MKDKLLDDNIPMFRINKADKAKLEEMASKANHVTLTGWIRVQLLNLLGGK